jgi:hypothetical protein
MAYMSPPDGTCNPHWFSSGATLDYFALFFLPTMGIQEEQKPSSDSQLDFLNLSHAESGGPRAPGTK